tara:strand:+ start:591 stop:1871 length:1281 start_codon:yes stop_codon:yes gene_type:complete
MRFIFIAGINRSGGSLLARLFDGHPKIASYPMEVTYPFCDNSFKFLEKLTGTPTHIPDFRIGIDPIKYFNIEKEKIFYKLGKETSSKYGIRKNYLEKAFYEKNIKTNFDYEKYREKLLLYTKNCQNNQELYEAKHKAYFESWDEGKNFNNPNYVVSHDSNGLFLNDFEKYFREFTDSVIFIPIRDCLGYIAAEKTRIARRYFGSKRFARPVPPNFLVKKFSFYDLDSLIITWNISLSRIKLLKEKFKNNNRLIIYRLEKLTSNTEEAMKFFSEKIDIEYDQILTKPTIKGENWLGNSQQGINSGVNQNPNAYYKKVLRSDEINKILKKTGEISNILKNIDEINIDLSKLNDDHFYDIKNQRKYINDVNSWSLYCSLGFKGFRKLKLEKPNSMSLIALIFSLLVKVYHFPRLFKQRYFPGLGKQNYT